MNLEKLLRHAWNSGMGSHHVTKSSKQLKKEEDDFIESIEEELDKVKALNFLLDEAARFRVECRNYLMGVDPEDLNVEDCLEALGYGRNGLGN